MAKPATSEAPDDTLIRAMVDGDEEALRAFNQRYGHAVVTLAYRILGDAADAEEVAADVLWQVWRRAASFDPARGSPGAWLMSIARSRAIDRLRARSPRATSAEPPPEAKDPGDPARELYSAECRRSVARAMAGLADGERAALELAYFSGLSQSEIAARTGLPLGTVKSRIRSGLIKLRDGLRGLRE